MHTTEDSRFDLALLVVVPVVGIALLIIFTTYWAIAGFLLTLIGIVWVTLQIAKASLTANAVKVSVHNFPEIYHILKEVVYALDYKEPVDIYIVSEGTVNAFLAKFFDTKFIILNSELVEGTLDREASLQIKWVIARFIGALKAKHHRLFFLRMIVDSIEKIKIFNIFILPYERATQYSGDQIGLAVCGDLGQALHAFQRFMVGNKLSKHVSLKGLQAQKRQMGFFAMVARLLSSHPHTVDRFHNLLAFAKIRYPHMYTDYIQSRE